MSEYGMALKEFYYDYSPSQIRMLHEKVLQRQAIEMRRQVTAIHSAKPQELSESLERETRGYYSAEPKLTVISDQVKERFKIKTIGNEDGNR